MVNNLLKEYVAYSKKASDWQDAIRQAAQPLLEAECITENYVNKIISNVIEHGPYIVIMPRVALPHSHAEDGALKTALSILKLQEPVEFPQNKMVDLLIVLSANDNNKHMELLSELCEVLMNDSTMQAIFNSNSREEVLACL